MGIVRTANSFDARLFYYVRYNVARLALGSQVLVSQVSATALG